MSGRILHLIADAGAPVQHATPAEARPRPLRPRGADRDFQPEAIRLLDSPPSPVAMAFNVALCGTVAAFLAWSWLCHVDVFAEATGRLQAPGRTQVVEPAEGGDVTAILARDGDHVRRGQAIVELESGPAIAAEAAARTAFSTARAEVARRRAAMSAATGDPVDPSTTAGWPADLPADVRDREAIGLRSDLAALAATLAGLSAQRTEALAQRDRAQTVIPPQRRILDLLHEHSGMRDATWRKGYDSRATMLQALQQEEAARLALVQAEGALASAAASIPVIDAQVAATRQAFMASNAAALVAADGSLDALRTGVLKAGMTTAHMTLRAPLDGTVTASAVTTNGQVLTAGMQAAQVVPDEGGLEFEVYVSNQDIGFVRAGQEATVKVDTYPYTRYGTVPGVVTHVARDALTGAQASQRQSNATAGPSGQTSATSASQPVDSLVFPVTVRPGRLWIDVDDKRMPLTPGMTATIEIRTESRRVLDYIMSPVVDVMMGAAHER